MGVLNISPKMQKAVLITTLTTIKNEKFWWAFSFCCSPIWLETSAQPPVAIIVPIASAMARNGPAMLTAESVSVPKMLDTKNPVHNAVYIHKNAGQYCWQLILQRRSSCYFNI